MTQQYVPTWTFYVADGVQTTYAYPWMIAASSEIEARIAGVVTTAYTVTGVGVPSGGNVVFLQAPQSGTILFLRRVTPLTQLLDLVHHDPFGAESLEAALDTIVRQIQDAYELLSRIPRLAHTILNNLRHLEIPPPGGGKVLGWNTLGTALQLYDYSTALQTVPGHAFGVSSALVPSVDQAGALVAAGLIPAGVRCSKVVYQCTEAFGTSRGLTSLNVGDSDLADRWGAALAITLGTTSGYGYGLTGDVESQDATDVYITANGGPFDADGACKVYAFWQQPVLE